MTGSTLRRYEAPPLGRVPFRWLVAASLFFAASLVAPSLASAQTNTFLVVSCDCGTFGGMALYIDGQQQGQVVSSVRAEVEPGAHQVKVDVWSGPFHHEVWWQGRLNVPQNYESRYQARKGGIDFVGKTKLAPVKQHRDEERAQKGAPSRGDLQDALDYVKDALDKSDDEPSRCATKVGDRLDELVGILKDVLDDEDPSRGASRALRRAKDVASLAEDICPPRVAREVNRPLRKAIARLGGGGDDR